MLLSLFFAPAAIILVSAVQTENDPPRPAERSLLACTGTMSAAGVPPSPIVANGLVDLAQMRVRGFGIGDEPIVYVTDSVIGFGSKHDGAGELVEGSIERATGKTELVVRMPGDASAARLALDLTCRFSPPLGAGS